MERGRELLVEAGRKRSVSVRQGSASLHVMRWGFVLVWAAEPVLVGPGFLRSFIQYATDMVIISSVENQKQQGIFQPTYI